MRSIVAAAMLAPWLACAQEARSLEPVSRLDLDAAARIASENSPAVIAAATDLRVKAADLEAARLFWRPTVSLQNSTLYGRGESTSFQAMQKVDEPGVPSGFSEGRYTSNALVVTLPLYSSGTWFSRETPAAQQAQANQAVSEHNLKLQAAGAANLVVKAYFNALLAREQLVLYREEYESKSRALDIVRQRVAARQSRLADQRLVESAVSLALSGMQTAESLLASSIFQLRSLLGVPSVENIELAAVADDVPEVPPLGALLEWAVRDHPKYASQQATVEAARAALLLARGSYGPTLSFSSSIVGANNLQSSAVNTFTSIGFVLAVPIVDFGQSDARIAAKQHALTQSEQQLDSVRGSVERDLASARHTATGLREQIGPARARLDYLVQVQTTTQANYERGLAALDKLIDDQYNVLAQRVTLLASKYAAWSAYADLVNTAGRTYSEQALVRRR